MVETTSIVDYFYQNGYIDSIKSSNYLELFHNLIIKLINNEKYEELVELCYDVYSFDPNITLISKLIFTFINLQANQSAIDLCELHLRNAHNDDIFYEVIDEFLKYDNYSGAIDLCKMYIKVNPKGNLGFIFTIILASLRKGLKFSKIFDLIETFLDLNHGVNHVYKLIHSMLEIQNYKELVKICKLILESNSKEKLKLLNIITLLYENGKNKIAWELCKLLLRFYPSSIDVLILYGSILLKIGKAQQARKLFTSILNQLSSTTPKLKSKILNFIGWTYLHQGDWKKATNPCIKSMKLNPKFPDSYNNLGLVYAKKGYVDKGIKLIKRALKLNPGYSQAWVNLGNIYFEAANYYEAFNACYHCLSINNQHQEGITLYKNLSNNHDVKILSYLIPKMIQLGYRCGFDSLNEIVFPNNLLKNRRYITYSKEFLNFLKRIRLAQMYLNNFISIYCWLPKCNNCESLLKLYGERINYKDGFKTRMYRCETCGKEKREVEQMANEEVKYLKVRIILKEPLLNYDKETRFYSKLEYEKIFITYSTIKEIEDNLTSKSSDLLDNLGEGVLLYGQDIREMLL
ncbi:MAG: tetratricopeptide repeat protein [Promethearchaeota archaeon]